MSISYKEVEDYLLSFDNSFLDYPFGEEPAVYKVKYSNQDKMFALLVVKNDVLSLSLKCDPLLATNLRDKYESVMPGYHLSKKHWNTIVLSGQLNWQEVKALIQHSYDLVCNKS